MHTLVMLRHAKSAYPEGVDDHDRPLAPRGIADAAAAGEWIRDRVGVPDHVAVSTARRARDTWILAAPGCGHLTDDLRQLMDPRIYEASDSTLLAVVRDTPDDASCALLVGHNPGVERLVGLLAGSAEPAAAAAIARKYATCGTAVLTFDGPWSQLAAGAAHLTAYAAPRG